MATNATVKMECTNSNTVIGIKDEAASRNSKRKQPRFRNQNESSLTEKYDRIELNRTSSLEHEQNRLPLLTLTFYKVKKEMKVLDSVSKGKWIMKTLLHGISGEVKPGHILALMGPSGSGKTTLLNTLAGRALTGVSGTVLVNGIAYQKDMKRKLAYVLQEDLFFDKLTVKEHLTYTALLRLPGHYTKHEKLDQVGKVIEMLGLKKCENTTISVISGGEKKRVNIGSELLTGPNLIFLDEPTSGLDSTSAYALVSTLKNLALQGKTIITSIHQPSSQIFQSFDLLILLADGKTIFMGEPCNALPYFSTLGHHAPAQYNPADYIMDLINGDSIVKESLKNEYSKSQNSLKTKPHPHLIKEPTKKEIIAKGITGGNDGDRPGNDGHELSSKWPTGFKEQFVVLFLRSLKLTVKEQLTILNIIHALLIAAITGLCWFRLPYTESSVPDRSSYVFFVMVFWPSQTLFSGLMSFPSERSIIARERASGSYRLSAYFLAKSASEAPLKLVLPTAFLIISYWMANINPFFPFFLAFVGIEMLAILVAESIGLLIGASVKNLQQAMVIAMVSLLTFMLVGGFFIRALPYWFGVWAKWLSFFKYAFDACQRLEFSGDHWFACENGTYIDICRQPNVTEFYGHHALEYLQVDLGILENILILLGMLVVFRILAYIALRFVKTNDGRN